MLVRCGYVRLSGLFGLGMRHVVLGLVVSGLEPSCK